MCFCPWSSSGCATSNHAGFSTKKFRSRARCRGLRLAFRSWSTTKSGVIFALPWVLKGKWLSQSPVALAGRVLLSPPAARCRRDVPRAAREAAALAQEQVPLPSCNKNNNKKKKAERKAKSVSQLPGAAAARGLSLSPLLLLAREVSPSLAAGGTAPGK